MKYGTITHRACSIYSLGANLKIVLFSILYFRNIRSSGIFNGYINCKKVSTMKLLELCPLRNMLFAKCSNHFQLFWIIKTAAITTKINCI